MINRFIALVLFVISITYASNAFAIATPIVNYQFDECEYTGVANEVIDQTGNFNASVNGITSNSTQGVANSALDLSATNTSDWASLPHELIDGLNNFTVSVWFQTSVTKSQQEIFQALSYGNGNDDELEIYLRNSRQVVVKVGDRSETLNSSITLTDGDWHHLAVIRVRNIVCLFIDGQQQDCDNGVGSGQLRSKSNAVVIGQEQDRAGGSFTSSQSFVGLLDEFKIFDEQLSSSDIRNIYQNELAGNNYDGSERAKQDCFSLLAEYRFEEEFWDGTADEILDYSGNDYHGKVLYNSDPETTSPALTGNTGTCGYASQDDGSIQVTGLPLNTSTRNVKTTVTFWMNWDGTNNTMPIGWNIHDIWIINGSIGFNTGNSDVFGTSSSGLANGWHHIAVEFTNGNVSNNRMYIDGVEQSLSQRLSRPNNSRAYVDSELRIGGWSVNDGYDFHGLIDEVRIYEGSLTTSQVKTIMDERHPCPSTPIIEYRFDEFKWSDLTAEVIDSSTSGYHATPFNGSVTSDSTPVFEGSPGTCHYGQFDGDDDYVELPSSFPDLTESLTITAWINAADLNSGSRIFIDDQNNTKGFGFSLGDGGAGKLRLYSRAVRPVSVDTRNAVITTNKWYFVAAVHDVTTKTIQIYVDGVAQVLNNGDTISSYTGTWGSDPGPASIGGETNNSRESGSRFHFNGSIDEPKVYTTALSESQIVKVMNETRTCPTFNAPVLEYRFDELSWNGSSDEVLDNTGGGLNGRAVGNANTITEGLLCRAGEFDGTNDYINISGLNEHLSTTATLSFWMKSTQTGVATAWLSPGIVGTEQRGGSNDIFWGYLDLLGNIRFQRGNGLSVNSTTPVNDNSWHHIVMTWDSSNGAVQTYIDGEIENKGTSTAGDVTLSFSSIGRIENSFSSNDYVGQLDEFLVFDSVLTASTINSIYTNQLRGDNYDGTPRVCPASPLDHYEIHHDGNGFTCETETITIKACANADCSILYTEPTSISLSPSGWIGGDTITFTGGETTASLSITDERTIIFSPLASDPTADLVCFNGINETCDMTFSDDGFELFGANVGSPLPDQLAASNFINVNVRAVRSVDNVCEALLQGPQEITLSYDCESPNQCLTPLNDISIAGDGTGESSGDIAVVFDAQGVASLGMLNYPDAGRLTLSVATEIDGVTFENSDKESVDVYPSYLELSVAETELLYGGAGNQNNYVAAENFTFVIGAYGTNHKLLRNYQAENPELKVERVSPVTSGENGIFKYSDSGTTISGEGAAFSNAAGLTFSDGEHSYPMAHYTEVGRIEIDVKDANYLGNEVAVADTLILGDFYPAYFDVALTEVPTLADTCNSTFSYLGQSVDFETSPEFTITAYNALGDRTFNYSDIYWNYLPEKPTAAELSFVDTSTYTSSKSASVLNLGDLPIIASNDNYDGSGTVTINNASFRYNKVDPTNNRVFAPVSPFEAQLTLAFTSDFFVSTFVDQNGNEDSICYQASHTDTSCLGWDIEEVTGTQVRYGRLVLESTYGPETESLNVPIKSEYYNANQWLLNTDDSNCTSIDFSEANGEIHLSDTSFANSFNSVTSTGVLIEGVAVGNQFTLEAPNSAGELDIWLDPTATSVTWPIYLNYDWSGDGFINTDDFPQATVTFGLFRGSDRIIHWREVFN